MGTKVDKAVNNVKIQTTVTVLVAAPALKRVSVTLGNFYDTSGSGDTVVLVKSSDATLGNGEEIDTIAFDAKEAISPLSALVSLDAGWNLLATAGTNDRIIVNMKYQEFSTDAV